LPAVGHDLQSIHTELMARAADIAIKLLGQPNRVMSSRRKLRFGNHGSLAVAVAGPKAGLWYDHEIGEGGDLLSLVERGRRAGFADALEHASALLGASPPPSPIRAPNAARRQCLSAAKIVIARQSFAPMGDCLFGGMHSQT
jgi:putative DNA primase/helicase